MTLTKLLAVRSNLSLTCVECDAHQAAHLPDMIAKHHPDMELDMAMQQHDCMFCGTRGRFRYIEPVDWTAELRKRLN